MGEVALRYAVLWHCQVTEPHFDLLFETYPGSDLATWRSSIWPIENPTTLKRLKDHRRIYLEYEGELTEHRGQVVRVAEGTCRVEIGEQAVWTIAMLNTPIRLILRQVEGDEWTAIPD